MGSGRCRVTNWRLPASARGHLKVRNWQGVGTNSHRRPSAALPLEARNSNREREADEGYCQRTQSDCRECGPCRPRPRDADKSARDQSRSSQDTGAVLLHSQRLCLGCWLLQKSPWLTSRVLKNTDRRILLRSYWSLVILWRGYSSLDPINLRISVLSQQPARAVRHAARGRVCLRAKQ